VSQDFVTQQLFSLEIFGTDDENVAGACCRSKLPRVKASMHEGSCAGTKLPRLYQRFHAKIVAQ